MKTAFIVTIIMASVLLISQISYHSRFSRSMKREMYLNSCEELTTIKEGDSDVIYYLESTIDCTGIRFESLRNFMGTLDGRGYAIINYEGDNAIFSGANRATFQNLQLLNFVINANNDNASTLCSSCTNVRALNITLSTKNPSDTNTITGFGNVGGIFGSFIGNGEIINCIVENTVVVSTNPQRTSSGVGGLVGYFQGIMNYSHNLGFQEDGGRTIINSQTPYTGGLVGRAVDSTITRSGTFQGLIMTSEIGSSPVVGQSSGSMSFSQIYSGEKSQIISENTFVGGILGMHCSISDETVIITDCYSQSVIRGQDIVGGLVGQFSSAESNRGSVSIKMENCYYSGVPSGQTIGNIVGNIDPVASNMEVVFTNVFFNRDLNGFNGVGTRPNIGNDPVALSCSDLNCDILSLFDQRIIWGGIILRAEYYFGIDHVVLCASSCVVPIDTLTPISTETPSTLIPSTTAPSTTEPSTLTPSTTAPSTTAPSTTEPSTLTPSTTAPSTTEPSTLTPSTTAPSTTAPSTTEPSTLTPSTTEPSTLTPSTTAPSTTEPSTLTPSTTAPSTTEPSTLTPSTTAPSTTAPSTTEPSTLTPSTTAPSTTEPSTLTPSTTAPSTTAPSTTEPSTITPSTTAPSTTEPSTLTPSTTAPSTTEPSTITPSTTAPSTTEPSTITPSTTAPSTTEPSTLTPSTTAPSTLTPSTTAPSTTAPSTTEPSTITPSTTAPSTTEPSTLTPSTSAPSTILPSTLTPSALTPSTTAPSTTNPSTTEPSTTAPSTLTPSTTEPSILTPSTNAPSTLTPSTTASTTAPSTILPSTTAPSTIIPSTTTNTVLSTTTQPTPSTSDPSTFILSTLTPSTTEPSTTVPSTLIPSSTEPSTTEPSTLFPSSLIPSTLNPSVTVVPCLYEVPNCENCPTRGILLDQTMFNISCVLSEKVWGYTFTPLFPNTTTTITQVISLNKTTVTIGGNLEITQTVTLNGSSIIIGGNFNQTSNTTIVVVLSPENNRNGNAALNVSGCVTLSGNISLVLDQKLSNGNSNISLINYNCSQKLDFNSTQLSVKPTYKDNKCDKIGTTVNNQQNSLSVSLSSTSGSNCKGIPIGAIIGIIVGCVGLAVVSIAVIAYLLWRRKNRFDQQISEIGNEMN